MTSQTTLPEAVQRQLDEAEALEKQLYGTPTPEGNTDDPTPAPATPEPEPQPEPEGVVPEPQPDPEEETYRQRYEVLQGKYTAEVPRLHAQLRELTTTLSTVQAELAQIKAQAEKAPDPAVPDKDAETFGEDLVEMTDRRSEAKTKALMEEVRVLRENIAFLKSKMGAVDEQVALSAQDRFLVGLAKEVPDYESINVDQAFMSWLAEADPVYGVPRQLALDNAVAALDAGRVATIFNTFKVLTRKQPSQKEQVRQQLERQVAPSAARSAPPVAPQGKTLTSEDFRYAYDPRTRFALGDDAVARLQAEVDQAVAEGRIQW